MCLMAGLFFWQELEKLTSVAKKLGINLPVDLPPVDVFKWEAADLPQWYVLILVSAITRWIIV